MIDCLDPEIEFAPGPEAGPFRTVCHGREEVGAFFKRLSKVVVKFGAEPLRYFQAGDEVLVAVQMYGRFSRGVEVWISVIHCWTVRDGRIVGWRSFPDTGTSLEEIALGAARYRIGRTGADRDNRHLVSADESGKPRTYSRRVGTDPWRGLHCAGRAGRAVDRRARGAPALGQPAAEFHIEPLVDLGAQQTRLTIANYGGPAREVQIAGVHGAFGYFGLVGPTAY